jgi:hypothetical protein
MRHVSALAFGLLLVATPGWAAEKNDPCAADSSVSDVRFELALKDHGAVLQAGEIVPRARKSRQDEAYERVRAIAEEHSVLVAKG